MKRLTCEMCGSTDLIKQDGVFVCQSCGCKYSVEEAKKMMIEGTVEVQGTVKIDNTDSITELIKRAFISIEDSEWEKAEECFNQVLSMDAECAEAYLGLSMIEKRQFSIKDLVLTDALDNKYYKRAKQFAGEKLLAELHEYEAILEKINDGIRKKQEKLSIVRNMISAGYFHTVALQSDGTVIATGDNSSGQCNVRRWKDIIAISAGINYTIGLKSNGTLVSTEKYIPISSWSDIVAIDIGSEGCDGFESSFGIKSDGTVLYSSEDEYFKKISKWRDIVSISGGGSHTVGLKSDSTVVCVCDEPSDERLISNWKDIAAVSVGHSHVVGLKHNGTVVAVGENRHGECEVSEWTDIVAVSAGGSHTVGLKSDGTVVATKYTGKKSNYLGECDVEDWTDIVAISAGEQHTIGLKAAGTILSTGDNNENQCDVQDWKLFDKFEEIENEIAAGRKKAEENRIAEKQKREEKRLAKEKLQAEMAEYRSKGLCQHCGGEFKGLFTKKCIKCGKPKDY